MSEILTDIFQWLIIIGFFLFIVFCIKDLFMGVVTLVDRFITGPRQDAYAYEREQAVLRRLEAGHRDPTRPDDGDPLGRLWDGR